MTATPIRPNTMSTWYVWITKRRARGLLNLMREHLADGQTLNPPRAFVPPPPDGIRSGTVFVISPVTFAGVKELDQRLHSDVRLRGAEFWWKSQEQVENERAAAPHERAKRITRRRDP